MLILQVSVNIAVPDVFFHYAADLHCRLIVSYIDEFILSPVSHISFICFDVNSNMMPKCYLVVS